MASDPIGSVLGSVVEGITGGDDGSGGGTGDLLGGVLGSVLGDSVGGGFDPESMAVDVVGKLLGLNETDLGIAKAALGAVTGDPMAIAAGVEDTVKGLASGQSPFAPLEDKDADSKTSSDAQRADDAEDPSDVDTPEDDSGEDIDVA